MTLHESVMQSVKRVGTNRQSFFYCYVSALDLEIKQCQPTDVWAIFIRDFKKPLSLLQS